MLLTLTREIRPGVKVTVREPSNADFYVGRRLQERFVKPDDDEDMQEQKYRCLLLSVRTVSVEGDGSIVALPRLTASSTDEAFDAVFATYMDIPHNLTKEWVDLVIEVGSTAPKN